MKREIINPSQFQGDNLIYLSGFTAWAYTTDRDIQFDTAGRLNASAQTEFDYSFFQAGTSLNGGQALNIWQEVTDPGENHVCYHYSYNINGESDGNVEFLCLPYVTEKPSSGDETAYQFLQGQIQPAAADGASFSLNGNGCVIRDKNSVGDDTVNLAFGVLLVNIGSGASTVLSVGTLSVHPNSSQLKISDPGV